jgi:hypothetical protein
VEQRNEDGRHEWRLSENARNLNPRNAYSVLGRPAAALPCRTMKQASVLRCHCISVKLCVESRAPLRKWSQAADSSRGLMTSSNRLTVVLVLSAGALFAYSAADSGRRQQRTIQTVVPLGYRVGAECNDGSRSSATGSGACSHHYGVARWITYEIRKQKKSETWLTRNEAALQLMGHVGAVLALFAGTTAFTRSSREVSPQPSGVRLSPSTSMGQSGLQARPSVGREQPSRMCGSCRGVKVLHYAPGGPVSQCSSCGHKTLYSQLPGY